MRATADKFDPTTLIIAPSSPEPAGRSKVIATLVTGTAEAQAAALATLERGLELLESASRSSVWVDDRHLPKLDAHQLFQLRNVRRSFLQILDALGDGNTLNAEQRHQVGAELGSVGQRDYQRLWAENSRKLMKEIYSIDPASDRESAILNEALSILSVAATQLHVPPRTLLQRPPVKERFLQLLHDLPQQDWFGKDLEPSVRRIEDYAGGNEPKKSDFDRMRDWCSEQSTALLQAAFTVKESTPFRDAAGKSYQTTAGHTAHVWEFGVQDGEVIMKGTVKDAGMFYWNIQGKDLGGDPAYDLDPQKVVRG